MFIQVSLVCCGHLTIVTQLFIVVYYWCRTVVTQLFIVDILVCCWHPTVVAQLFIAVYCCCLTIVAQQFIVDILVCCQCLTVVAQPFIVDILVYCCCEMCHVFSLMFINPQWGFRNTFLTCQCWAVIHITTIFLSCPFCDIQKAEIMVTSAKNLNPSEANSFKSD